MERSPDSLLTVLILAAGRGERFGGHKLSARIQGKVILEWLLIRLTEFFPNLPRTVITRPEEVQLQMVAAKYDAKTVLIDSTAMGYSLAAGVDATAKAAGWLVLLADQPLVDPELVRRLMNLWHSGNRAVSASLSGRLMPPAIFDASLREKLLSLHLDEGASRILRQEGGVGVPWPKGDWSLDLDTPGDLKVLSAQIKKATSTDPT